MDEPIMIKDGQSGAVIKVEGLYRYYGRRKKVEAVSDVSFAVSRGEVFGLIGPDGAGKTSIIQVLAGVLKLSGGKASVSGIDVKHDPEGVKEIVGYMPQGIGLNLYDNLSVKENIDFFRDLRNVPRQVFERNRKELLEMTRLAPFLNRKARHLSGGMRQKLALICTLIHLPDILFLDEPTTGVDPISRQDFWQIIHRLVKERQVTALITTSYMDEAERCHTVALLHEGRIIESGNPHVLKSKLKGNFFRLKATPQQEALNLLKLWEMVESSEVFGREIRLCLTATGEELSALLADHGILIEYLAPYDAGLEEFFIQLLSGDGDHAHPSHLPAQGDTRRAAFFPEKAKQEKATFFPAKAKQQEAGTGTIIECSTVSRRFDSFVAVDRVELAVMKGEVFGLLGPNGAGKTTLIKIMCGLIDPSEGAVRVAGFDVATQRHKVWSSVGYMSQRFSLYRDLTVLENLRLYAGLYAVRKMDFGKVTIPIGLSGLEKRLTRDLPLGIRQRLALACALLHDPPVLFLDEPTSGVDPVARRAFWEIIYRLSKESGVTIIVSTHYMDEAEHCDRLGFMHKGRLIASDTPSNLKSFSENRSGSLISLRNSDFRRAFDLLTAIFPHATLYGDHIRFRTFDPEADKKKAVDYLQKAGMTGVHAEQQPLPMQEAFIDYIMATEETEGGRE
jgi:ABC-type multidrug transport system ATPase subunit